MAEMYLKLTGINGDATAKDFENQIEVHAFNFGISQPGGGPHTSAGGHTGARAIPGDFTITKLLDSSSPLLFLYCSNGKVIADAVLTLRRPNEKQTIYTTYTFTNLVVSGYSPGGNGSETAMESVALRYDTLKVEYTPVTSKGDEGPKVTAGYNYRDNIVL